MRGTGQFEIAKFDIPAKFNQPQSIVFFGDVHKYAPGHCDKTWGEFKDKYRTRKDTWFIGMGDYMDLLSGSERSGFDAWAKHESTAKTIEDWIAKLADDFYAECEFMRGKLIGVIEGNHHYQFIGGTTTGTRFATKFQTNYLGDCALVRVAFQEPMSKRSASMDIALHHGLGGGRLTGSMFNSLDHMARVMEGCSIYAMGDNHQRGGVPIQRLKLSDNHLGPLRLKDREIIMLRTGSFLRGYIKGHGDYIVDKLMAPANLGSVRVDVTPTRKCINNHEYEDVSIKMEVIA